MSRTNACGISQSCTPAPPAYPYEEPEPAPPAEPAAGARDHVARPGAARARLTRLSGESSKFAGGQRRSPCPALEQDPAVKSYRFSPEEQRYQVTRYDPKLVRFTRDGRPLTGPTVKLDNRQTRLDDAINIVRGRAEARRRAVQTLEETPFGTKALLSAGQCRPVYQHLDKALRHTARAEELLRAGEGEAAKQALARATRAYNDASIKLNSAKRQIENNVELAVGMLKALKAAGEVAEIGLVGLGVGAVGKAASGLARAAGASDWAITAAKIVGSTAVKSGHAAFDQVRDQWTFEPDKPVDWSKVGDAAAKGALWGLISGTVSDKIEGLMTEAGSGKVQKAALRIGQKVAKVLLRSALEQRTKAARAGETATPRQLADWATTDAEVALRKALSDEGYDVTRGTGKAILKVLFKSFTEQKDL